MLCVTRPVECFRWAIKRCEKDPAEKRNGQYKRPNEFRDDAVASMHSDLTAEQSDRDSPNIQTAPAATATLGWLSTSSMMRSGPSI